MSKGNGKQMVVAGSEAAAVKPSQEVTKPSAGELAANPLDLPAEVFRSGLARRKENRAALMEWIREALVEGVDYGRIHAVGKAKCRMAAQGRASECLEQSHWSKPSLFKPGAEKICGMLGVSVHFPTLKEYEQAALSGTTLQLVIIRCEIKEAGAGRIVADGVGARSVSQDYGDINKSLKMAEKSAHIDAALRMAGLSEVFTQDLEDMRNLDSNQASPLAGDPARSNPRTPVAAADKRNGSGPVPSGENGTISESELNALEARIAELGLDHKRVKAWLVKATARHPGGPVNEFSQLPLNLLAPLYSKLDEWANEPTQTGSKQ